MFIAKNKQAFTIVELLIVVVVIAILATITIVAFNGVTRNAAVAALQSDLKQAATALELHKIDASSYPATEGAALAIISASDNTTYQYSFVEPNGYCLSATATDNQANVPGYHITNASSTPVEGVCDGHTGPAVGGGESSLPVVSVGSSHSLALVDGQVYAWGRGSSGQLGQGNTDNQLSPVVVNGGDMAGKTIVKISAGNNHNLALDSDGQVYAWGVGGRTGDGTTTQRNSPVLATGALVGKNITSIAAGGSHSLALDDTGQVYAWGTNTYGQVGNGTSTNQSSPVAVTGGALSGKTIIKITAGTDTSFAIDTSGNLYAWGRDYYGALGTPVGHAGGGNIPNPLPLLSDRDDINGKNIVDITAGEYHGLALDDTGQLYAWGGNNDGQVGKGNYVTQATPLAINPSALSGKTIVSIVAGGLNSAALDSDGNLYTWGSSSFGQIGDGLTTNRSVPTSITGGSLSGLTLSQISIRNHTMIAVDSSGGLHFWGYNGYGKGGDGTTDNRYLPVGISVSP